MKINQKGFAPVILVLAVIALFAAGGAGFWYYTQTAKPQTVSPIEKITEKKPAAPITQTPVQGMQNTASPNVDETDKWQIYRNEKYGFEIKYPQNVVLSDEKDYNPPYENLLLAARFGEKNKEYCAEYDIRIENTNYENIQSWATATVKEIQTPANYEGLEIGPRNVISTTTLNIGNIPAKKIISNGGFPFQTGNFAVINGNKIYQVFYTDLTNIDSEKRKPDCFGQNGDNNKYLDIYDQMISTFKFIQ